MRVLSTYTGNADDAICYIKEAFFHSSDVKVRPVPFNGKPSCIVFLASAANRELIQLNVIKPLLVSPAGKVEDVAAVTGILKTEDLDEAVRYMAEGHCVFLTAGEKKMTLLNVYKPLPDSARAPNNEQVVRGSHQSFSENLMKNIQMLRERVRHPSLTVKVRKIGRTSQSNIAVVYAGKIANPAIVKEVERRLDCIQADSLHFPGNLEEYLEDYPFSPFPQILNTERPDRAAANLMDGRVAIVMEGSPTVLVLPVPFFSFFQSSEDYNQRTLLGSFFRLLRFLSFLIALGLPALYIALVSFNYEAIPVDLIFSIKNSLEFVPFQPLLEAIIMQVTLELLREASIRLPSPIAQTIGVVGGLVIGTAVVEAHLVSNTMIIVVAITAISSFVIPSNEMSSTIRILGFPIMLMSAMFGFFGIVISMMLILIHLVKLTPLGSPYLYPLAPFSARFFKDTLLRAPVWMMNSRPDDTRPVYSWRESRSRGWKKNE